jgi:hypothetical protein
MAERVGFEPTIPVKVYTLSKRAPSATRPSLRCVKCGLSILLDGDDRISILMGLMILKAVLGGQADDQRRMPSLFTGQ